MCLILSNKVPMVAEKPIRVWKLLMPFGSKYITPYQEITVNIGDTIRAANPDAPIQMSTLFENYTLGKQGVHAYTSKKHAKKICNCYDVVTEWEIPAGTKYWVGADISEGEIAATEMTFIKICHKNRFLKWLKKIFNDCRKNKNRIK